MSQGRSTRWIGDGHPTFNDGNPYNGCINPYYWVDEFIPYYMENLDPSTHDIGKSLKYPPEVWQEPPLKSYRDPIGKDRLPTSIFRGRTVKVQECRWFSGFVLHLPGCTQEVQGPNFATLGRIGNPWSMDHPKDQPLCLVGWTSRVYVTFAKRYMFIYIHRFNYTKLYKWRYNPTSK